LTREKERDKETETVDERIDTEEDGGVREAMRGW